MEFLIPAFFVLIKSIIKSPMIWAAIIGFTASFKTTGRIKKYLISGCTIIFFSYIGNLVFHSTMPMVWHSEGLAYEDISKLIVRYSKFIEALSAAGLLLIIRAAFVGHDYDKES